MRLSLLLALPLLCHAQGTTAPAQNATQVSQLASLAQFLTTSGENVFVNATERVVGTQVGSQFVTELVNAVTGNESTTIFVPDNNAFTGSPPKNITDLNVLSAIFTYHIIRGRLTTDNIASFPNYTLARTLMNSSQLVQLEGGEGQVLAITNDNGTIKVIGQNTPVQVVSSISLPSNGTNPNLQAYVLSTVLDPPPPLDDVFFSTNLSAFKAAAQQTSQLESLEATRGVTIFAPSDAAATVLTSGNNSALSNITALSAILGNHVINGTTVYSTQFPLNAISASGEPLTISRNSSGVFVSSGSSTAKIIQPDILTSNGVVHVINGVLLNAAENQTAASSAFASASSAAATAASAQATQTSPVGSSSPSGVGSSSSGSSGSTNSTSSNGKNGSSSLISHKASFGYIMSIFLSIIAGYVFAQ